MSVVKAQASISLALVSDGKTGPAGKDITSYAKGTSLPTTVAPANSQFWLLDANNQCIAVYVSNGSKWESTPISASLIVAASFKGMNFEGVTFTGSTFKTTYTNAANTVGDSGTKFTGTGKFAGPELVFDSMTDDTTPQAVRTAMAPEGFSAYAGKNAFGYFSAFGQMALGDANGHQGALDAELLHQINNRGDLLWTGNTELSNDQTITPSTPLSDCFFGWQLLWSRGDPTNRNQPSNSRFLHTFIPKTFAASFSGKGITIPINAPSDETHNTGVEATKYVYVTDTTLKNYAANSNANGKYYILREVRAW